ncbi:HAD family phosphatase [Sulfitobacter sp. M57]|uniref:HAD family hydrolase n=1 Tax=unclassified Sulfitobacter TaxID=196795 RepID=UPI0023E19528|nr:MULTISPECIES: HAD family phosphatase [unclassified Sulfitobacter]MDF3415439.1 HAD family phosphatase [Sulfitobacter sp. KE5]MDF3422920.1 HAD family phosphatase [Sulfitobacter sp. KE43]MDF3433985.1 HAD family phosphatase [Sulfitobacter sp. KE42]MDF3459625.1 HAD family phosphatase [Sulfitobacter sp. S74]MDF3463524.1 HAD family phosphatase [Sulfitobacter sp. Ks18]
MWKAKYVLFDCDGVLVDSETLTHNLLSQELGRYGLAIPAQEVGRMFVGGTMAGVMQTARQMGAELPSDWVAQFNQKLFARLAADCEIIPGVVLLLDRLDAAGIGYATCSNGPIAKMDVTLGRCGVKNRLAGRIFSAHDCAAAKPAPDVYLKAADVAGVDPADCAVIEDSATGARAGAAAGMRCFGFCAETDAENLSPHCTALFDDMDQLPGLLGL